MEVEQFWAFLTQLQRVYLEDSRVHQNQRLIALQLASTWKDWQFLRECYPQYDDIIDAMYHAAANF